MATKIKRGRRVVEGQVLKASNAKTRVIITDKMIPHRLYGRFMKRAVKFVAHDESEQSQIGDLVRIQECRPMSKTKRWRLIEVLKSQVEG